MITPPGRLLDGLRHATWARRATQWAWAAKDIVRVRRGLRRSQTNPDEFDAAYGVRTRVVPTLAELYRRTRRGGFEHEPSAPKHFREILDGLDVDFKQTLFVDYGSGAGRAILLASGYPFKAVVGIELSPSLHARAEANLRAFPIGARRAAAVRLVCADATTFELPPEPLVLYFYNPFGAAVMRRVLDRIEATLTRQPRPITIVLAYCYREPREVVERSPFFRVVRAERDVVTLATPAPGRSTA